MNSAKAARKIQNIADPERPLRNKRKRDTARTLRRDMTDAERKLWSLLRNRKLVGHKFRRQVAIGPYVADFVCFEARLIVEADGGQHAELGRDADRDAWLKSKGFQIQRFWNSDILTNPDGVLARLAEMTPTATEIPS